MILLDTNVLIEILKGHQGTVKKVEAIREEILISSISVMELYYGALNSIEVRKIEKFTALFSIAHIDSEISIGATQLVKSYAKSHSLDIPDSLIAATAIKHSCKLFTYNTKDFQYIKKLMLLKS